MSPNFPDDMSPYKPTLKGKINYPDTDGYYEEIPCTCEYNCPYNCKGQCGCEACSAAYSDFLSLE